MRNFIVAAPFRSRGVSALVAAGLIGALSFLGVFAATGYICSNSLTYIHVPSCSGATCQSMAKIGQGFSSYSQEVATAWSYANRYNSALRTAEDSCATMDANALAALLRSVVVDMDSSVRLSLEHSLSSVNIVKAVVASKYVELHDMGAQYAPYPEVRSLHAEFAAAAQGSDVSPLGSALSTYDHRIDSLSYKLSSFLNPSLAKKLANGVAHVYSGSLANLKLVPADILGYGIVYALERGADLLAPNVQPRPLIELTVGETRSIYTYARPLFKKYLSVRAQMDDRAENDVRDAKALRDEIYKGAVQLEQYVSVLSDENTLAYLSSQAVAVSDVVSPENAPDEFRLLADRHYRAVLQNVSAYQHGDINAFVRLYMADQNVDALHSLYTSEQKMLSAYQSIMDRCKAFLKSYSPRSRFARPYIEAALYALNHGGTLNDCARGLRYVELDKRYASVEAALQACYEQASVFGGVSCSGDPYSQLQCCQAFFEQKRAVLKTSETYRAYIDLLAKIRQLIGYYYDPELYSEYSSLPREFSSPKAMRDAMKRALDLYAKVRDRASKYVSAQYDVRGYLDARESVMVPVLFQFGIPGVSLDASVDLPFSAAGYRIVESNGLLVNIRGNKAYLHGGGTTLVEVLALPVSLDVEQLGESAGVAYVRVSNDHDVPVRYAYAGRVYSTAGAVTYDDKAVYFNGRGSAIIAERVLSQDVSISGDTASVTISNPSSLPYSGDIVLPFSAEHMPSYCESFGDATLCRVNLDPFERRVLRFSGVHESNTAALFFSTESNAPLPQPVVQDRNMSAVSAISVPAYERNAELTLASDLRRELRSTLSSLEQAYRRAVELNVVYLLPYDGAVLSELNDVLETGDPTELSSALALARQSLESLKSRAKILTYALPKDVPSRPVALRALDSGDYVLALAIASKWHPSAPGSNNYALYASVLAAASLAVLVYFLRTQGKRKKPRKKLPRI